MYVSQRPSAIEQREREEFKQTVQMMLKGFLCSLAALYVIHHILLI